MKKKKIYLIFLAILILFFLSANLSYPKYLNGGIDFLNSKLKLKIPHFPEIPFKLGLDLQGGSHLLYEADLSQIDPQDQKDAMNSLRDVIERRVNLFGVSEPIVQIQEKGGNQRLIVELAGVKDVSEAIKMIGETPYLEFLELRNSEETERILEKQKELEGKSPEEYHQVENWQLAFENPYFKPTKLTGKYLKMAEVAFNPTTNKPEIQLRFNEEGTKLFEEITERNIQKPLAIFLDGLSIVDTDGDGKITPSDLYAPVVQEKITGGQAVITGERNINRAREIVQRLNAGALPVPIKLISQQTVGPILGKISLEKSLKAGVVGFLTIILFMILFYRFLGILASLALLIYLSVVLALFKLIPVTLTLAGIAGFILSIGMAVDANILIFSRMREEIKEGKSFLVSVEEGFKRAWPSIRDSNFTTLIVSSILFTFGTSFVKGFAFTLILGVLISMFSAIFVTHNFLRLFIETRLEKLKFFWK